MEESKIITNLRKFWLWIIDLALNLIIIFALVFAIQKWIIAPFDISGASMCDTFNYINNECVDDFGEKIIINEAVYIFSRPNRGEVVVFKPSEDSDKYLIKRVIGLPGDSVKIANGNVYVRPAGEEDYLRLQEDYLNEENKGKTKPHFSEMDTFTVPQDSYFLLGDNRKNSTDSRSCFQRVANHLCPENPDLAYVEEDLIRGKAWLVWWPLKNLRVVSNPEYRYMLVNEDLEPYKVPRQ